MTTTQFAKHAAALANKELQELMQAWNQLASGKQAILEIPKYDAEITVECRSCGSTHFIDVKIADYNRYVTGKDLIQDCFPYLNADQRELIISHTCSTCWTKMFGEETFDPTQHADDCICDDCFKTTTNSDQPCGYCGDANDPDVICNECWNNMQK